MTAAVSDQTDDESRAVPFAEVEGVQITYPAKQPRLL